MIKPVQTQPQINMEAKAVEPVTTLSVGCVDMASGLRVCLPQIAAVEARADEIPGVVVQVQTHMVEWDVLPVENKLADFVDTNIFLHVHN